MALRSKLTAARLSIRAEATCPDLYGLGLTWTPVQPVVPPVVPDTTCWPLGVRPGVADSEAGPPGTQDCGAQGLSGLRSAGFSVTQGWFSAALWFRPESDPLISYLSRVPRDQIIRPSAENRPPRNWATRCPNPGQRLARAQSLCSEEVNMIYLS